MYKKILTNTILILLLFSTIISISFGKDSKITEQNKQLDNLAFYSTIPDSYIEIKYEYYKDQLLKQDSSKNINKYK